MLMPLPKPLQAFLFELSPTRWSSGNQKLQRFLVWLDRGTNSNLLQGIKNYITYGQQLKGTKEEWFESKTHQNGCFLMQYQLHVGLPTSANSQNQHHKWHNTCMPPCSGKGIHESNCSWKCIRKSTFFPSLYSFHRWCIIPQLLGFTHDQQPFTALIWQCM